ncbi:MAG: ROK family protein [Lachnospiraceae bacterium]
MKLYNQQMIKSINKKQVYLLINNYPGISRAEIATSTNLSKTTVSALTDELIQESFIIDTGASGTSRIGRKPNSLYVNDIKNGFIVVNWHKRNIEIALVGAGLGVKEMMDICIDIQMDYVIQIKTAITNFIHDFAVNRSILGICFIVPGIVNQEKKSIYSRVLNFEDDTDIISRLRNAIPNYPIAIFNDTACYAYAENIFGDNDLRNKNYAYLNINEGIGATLVNDGKILRGANGMSTQFGHFSINRNGHKCICGNRGCLENEIGELALPRRINDFGLTSYFENPELVLFRDIGKLAQEDEKSIEVLLDALAQDLGYGLSNLIVMFHPEKIIIGGKGKKLGEIFIEKVRNNVGQVGFMHFVKNVGIEYTSLGEEAAISGAVKYFVDMHFGFIEDMNGKLYLS